MKKAIAFFDVDGTLVVGYTNSAFFKFLLEKGEFPHSAWDESQRVYNEYLAGKRSYNQLSPLFIAALARGLRGKNVSWLEMRAKQFVPTIRKMLKPFVPRLLKLLGKKYVLVSVSASNSEVIKLLEKFGLGATIATEYEKRGEFFTGRVAKPIISPKQKLAAVRVFAARRGVSPRDCIAFGDAPSDELMLDAVGKGFVLMPTKEMKKLAAGKNWIVVEEERKAVAAVSKALRL